MRNGPGPVAGSSVHPCHYPRMFVVQTHYWNAEVHMKMTTLFRQADPSTSIHLKLHRCTLLPFSHLTSIDRGKVSIASGIEQILRTFNIPSSRSHPQCLSRIVSRALPASTAQSLTHRSCVSLLGGFRCHKRSPHCIRCRSQGRC